MIQIINDCFTNGLDYKLQSLIPTVQGENSFYVKTSHESTYDKIDWRLPYILMRSKYV